MDIMKTTASKTAYSMFDVLESCFLSMRRLAINVIALMLMKVITANILLK